MQRTTTNSRAPCMYALMPLTGLRHRNGITGLQRQRAQPLEPQEVQFVLFFAADVKSQLFVPSKGERFSMRRLAS